MCHNRQANYYAGSLMIIYYFFTGEIQYLTQLSPYWVLLQFNSTTINELMYRCY